MREPEQSFIISFSLAVTEALTQREALMVSLRYGLADGLLRSLEQVGQEFGLTRERIRQILQRVPRKLKARATRERKQGKLDGACASFFLSLERSCPINESDSLDHIVFFARNHLGYLPEKYSLPLLAALLYPREQAEQNLILLRRRYKELAHTERETHTWLIEHVKQEGGDAYISSREYSKRAISFEQLLSDIMWPRKVIQGHERFYTLFNSQSEELFIRPDPSGGFFSQKLGREVYYRSLLEKQFFMMLETTEEVPFYQERPFAITKMIEEKQRLWYPDVGLFLKDGKTVLVEVTPWDHMALHYNLEKYEALRLFCLDNGWGLLITDGKKTYQQIRKHPVPNQFRGALLEALDNSETHSLGWKEFKEVKDQQGSSWMDFLAIILAEKLLWTLRPFTLKRRVDYLK